MSAKFTHLDLHSEYSLLDGASRVKDIAKGAQRLPASEIKSILTTICLTTHL